MSHHNATRHILSILTIIFIFTGCSAAATLDDLATPTLIPELQISPLPMPLSAAPVNLAPFVEGNNRFALTLFQNLAENNDNLIFSPYSIETALAMVYVGARNQTAQQMDEVLHFSLAQEQLPATLNALNRRLMPATAAQLFDLSIANSLWLQQDYALLPPFRNTLAQEYEAGLYEVNFIDPDLREVARQAINQWVEDETNAKIKNLIEKNILNDGTRLVLANAIYFKAKWEAPFLSGTSDRPFTLLDGTQIMAPTMARRAATSYAESEEAQIVRLAYLGNQVEMIVVAPKSGQYEAFSHTLTPARLTTLIDSLQPASDLALTLPKFKFETGTSLGKTLAVLGMSAAFDPDLADFSGITTQNKLFITHVIHKAFIAVDEEGTEAAAATGVVMGDTSAPPTVQVDRPFLFVIREVESGLILFMGQVLNPL